MKFIFIRKLYLLSYVIRLVNQFKKKLIILFMVRRFFLLIHFSVVEDYEKDMFNNIKAN